MDLTPNMTALQGWYLLLFGLNSVWCSFKMPCITWFSQEHIMHIVHAYVFDTANILLFRYCACFFTYFSLGCVMIQWVVAMGGSIITSL